MNRVPAILTKDGITVTLFNKPYSVARVDAHFQDVLNAVELGNNQEEILDIFQRVAKKLQSSVSDGITYDGGVVRYKSEQLRGYAVDRLLTFLYEGYDVKPMAKFLEKIQENPSKTVVDNLYQFLEHGNMPITPEGNFVAYKAISANWKDIHSGTMDNSLGKTVSIARNKVDEDRNNTCSTGLHVCSFAYLPHFANVGGHVIAVEVNPKDVVAIPSDYNNTKMRVSEYTVIGEVTDYYKKNENVLASNPIYDEVYAVFTEEGDLFGEFDSFTEARTEALTLLEDYDYVEVRNSDGNVIFSGGDKK